MHWLTLTSTPQRTGRNVAARAWTREAHHEGRYMRPVAQSTFNEQSQNSLGGACISIVLRHDGTKTW